MFKSISLISMRTINLNSSNDGKVCYFGNSSRSPGRQGPWYIIKFAATEQEPWKIDEKKASPAEAGIGMAHGALWSFATN